MRENPWLQLQQCGVWVVLLNVRQTPQQSNSAVKQNDCKRRSRVLVASCRNQACADAAGGEASWWRMATSSVCTGDVRSLNASIGLASVSRLRRVSRRMR